MHGIPGNTSWAASWHDARQHRPFDAHIHVPAWMWGGDPNGFFTEAGLVGELVSSRDRWRVRVIEPHPPLVEAVDLAGPRITPPRWEILQRAVAEPFIDPNFFDGRYDDVVAAGVKRAERTQEPVDAFAAWQYPQPQPRCGPICAQRR